MSRRLRSNSLVERRRGPIAAPTREPLMTSTTASRCPISTSVRTRHCPRCRVTLAAHGLAGGSR